MFEWNSKIYMDEKVGKNPVKYKRMLEQKKLVKHCYVLTLPLNEKNCLDIYSSREFWFQYYHERQMEVVGLAVSMESAEELLCRMAKDVYLKYGDVDAESMHRFFEVQ
ncbi:MAG: hypothetical protein IJ733_16720 [Lachnospiraceae bacterium]|nr:hypothetical protein [Lachnospiraceae bacterium]